jgi:hypothetical protein
VIGAAGLAVLGLTGVSAAAEPAGSSQVTAPPASELFVQSAGRGILRRLPGHKHTYRLAFKGLTPRVTVFTDRPTRKAGTETTAQFVKRWRSRGFVKAPPNAALALSHASHHNDVKVFEISHPRLNRRTGTLSFVARDLGDKSTTALSGFAKRADRDIPKRFHQATLFVDASSTTAPYEIVTWNYVYSGPSQLLFGSVSLPGRTVISTVFTAGVPGSYLRSSVGLGNAFEVGCIPDPGIPCRFSVQTLLTPADSPLTGSASLPANSTMTAAVGGKAAVPVPNGAFSLK